MAGSEEINTNCMCQYTLSVTNNMIEDQCLETKHNFKVIPNIHEVSEDDEDNSENSDQCTDNPRSVRVEEDLNNRNTNIPEEESVYADDSFCSNDSDNESAITNVSSQSSLSDDCSFQNFEHRKNSMINKFQNKVEQVKDDANKINKNENPSTSKEDIKSCMTEKEHNTKLKNSHPKRKNMSFTDDEMRKIERENELLLRKIMAQHHPRDKVLNTMMPKLRISSSAINRKRFQKKVEDDNMLLLRRIQQTKSCVIPSTATPGYRMTFI